MRQAGVSTAPERARSPQPYRVSEPLEATPPYRTSEPLDATPAYRTSRPPRASEAPRRVRPARGWIDFELDESWERIPARRVAPDGPRGRRTVRITGRGAERDLAVPTYRSGQRPPTPRHERPGFKPDRTAMWAVLLGLLLVLVAATSSHAAALPAGSGAHPALAAGAGHLARVVAHGLAW